MEAHQNRRPRTALTRHGTPSMTTWGRTAVRMNLNFRRPGFSARLQFESATPDRVQFKLHSNTGSACLEPRTPFSR